MRINYHSHTDRCQHASGTEEAFVRQAIKSDYQILGFADHCPWKYQSDFVSGIRMLPEEMPDYIHTVRKLGQVYRDKIEVLCGFECEYFPNYMNWMEETAQKQKLDYLILGNHFDTTDESGMYFGSGTDTKSARRYVEMTTRGMQTGSFAYVAHPDLFLRAHTQFDAECRAASRDLCQAAKTFNLPLEYNMLGMVYRREGKLGDGLGYPCEAFWEVASDEGCQAIVGVDAHRPEHLDNAAQYDEVCAHLKMLGIERVTEIRRRVTK